MLMVDARSQDRKRGDQRPETREDQSARHRETAMQDFGRGDEGKGRGYLEMTTRQPTRNGQQPVLQMNALLRILFTTCACSWQYKSCLDLYSRTVVLNQVKYILYPNAPSLLLHFPPLHFDSSLSIHTSLPHLLYLHLSSSFRIPSHR